MTITALAHTALCVPDVEAAVEWYRSVLGLEVLSPPYLLEGHEIERDMGELIPDVRLKAAIVGFPDSGDRVLELLEYPGREGTGRRPDASLTDQGLTHVGLLCDDIAGTRNALEANGVQFLTSGIADIMGLRTTWFRDPWGVIFILLEKTNSSRPYFRQGDALRPPAAHAE